MLTSKLILVIFTWGMALLVSIALRAAGIVHPESFYINHLLVWVLVFGPSIFLLIYFLLKRFFSVDWLVSSWGLIDYKFCISLFYFHVKPWCSRFIDFWSKYRYLVDLCPDFVWVVFSCIPFSMVCRIIGWKPVRKIY